MEKRIYSLNLAAYVMMATGIQPELNIEYPNGGRGLVYCVFPVVDAVAAAINAYKKDTQLHNYLSAYAQLRELIKECEK